MAIETVLSEVWKRYAVPGSSTLGLYHGPWHLASSRTPYSRVPYRPQIHLLNHVRTPTHSSTTLVSYTERNIIPSLYIYYYIMRHRKEWKVYTVRSILNIQRARAREPVSERDRLSSDTSTLRTVNIRRTVFLFGYLWIFLSAKMHDTTTFMHTHAFTQ